MLRLALLLWGIHLAILAGALLLARARPQESPALLAYVGSQHNQSSLYVMWSDGSHSRQLSPPGTGFYLHSDIAPAWSVDGRWLAFSSDRNGNQEIYRMRSGGGPLQRLTHNSYFDSAPFYSPDGQWLLYLSYPNSTRGELRRIPASGGRPETLFSTANISLPGWSQDGRSLLFLSPTLEFRSLPPTPTTLQPAAQAHYVSLPFAWSPDGQWVVFSAKLAGNPDIYRLRVADGYLEQLTDSLSPDYAPDWSPDGRWIVFSSGQNNRYQLYRMRPDGSDLERFSPDDGRSYFMPRWSPLLADRWQPLWLIFFALLLCIPMFQQGRS